MTHGPQFLNGVPESDPIAVRQRQFAKIFVPESEHILNAEEIMALQRAEVLSKTVFRQELREPSIQFMTAARAEFNGFGILTIALWALDHLQQDQD
jgi:hypothetical protein